MKYLKRFNEDITSFNFEEELQEFCELNLVYLTDEGAEIQIVESPGGYSELHLIRILLDQPKRWNEIKDHMIPFLTRLDNKYEINNKPFKETSNGKYKAEDIRLYISFSDDTHREPGMSYMTSQVKDFQTCLTKVIEDKSTWPNARISDISLYVKGYKQEKKSILTKIKNYFK
jgi:hypothetical protein